jgi:metallo-beta-lactamase family protein
VVIPTFAIERAQELMYHLSRLVREDRIPYLMIFLDSPMAVDVTDVFVRHREYLDEETHRMFREGEPPFRFPGLRLVRSVAESKAINSIRGSCVIMAGSGMCTGGRIKHHLVQNIARAESQLLFVGYQARGTLGRLILDGKEEVRIHGRHYPVLAGVNQIQGFSAHADRGALLRWLGFLEKPPKQVILTHGEDGAIQSLAEAVSSRTGWETRVPDYLETLELD